MFWHGGDMLGVGVAVGEWLLVGVLVGVWDGVWDGDCDGVGLGDGDGVRVRVGVTLDVRVSVRVELSVRVGVCVKLRDGVGDCVRLRVGVTVSVKLGVGVTVCVKLGVGVTVGVRLRVGVTVGVRLRVGVTVCVSVGVLEYVGVNDCDCVADGVTEGDGEGKSPCWVVFASPMGPSSQEPVHTTPGYIEHSCLPLVINSSTSLVHARHWQHSRTGTCKGPHGHGIGHGIPGNPQGGRDEAVAQHQDLHVRKHRVWTPACSRQRRRTSATHNGSDVRHTAP